NAYTPKQLNVSGPMRPIKTAKDTPRERSNQRVNVLWVAEQTVYPPEVLPYIEGLLNHKNVKLTLKFRPFNDGFENWLKNNKPEFLERKDIDFIYESMESAIRANGVVIGC